MSTSSERSSLSGDTRSKWIFSAIYFPLRAARLASRAPQHDAFCYGPVIVRGSPASSRGSLELRRVGCHFLRLGHHLFDGTHHVEGLLRQVIIFAVDDRLERAD